MTSAELTPEQRTRERSFLVALGLDSLMLVSFTAVGLLGGSLTIIAELLRGVLGYSLECFSFLLLRRIHRGSLSDMEYGAGKVEQVANLLLGSSMLMACGWVLLGVVKILTGERHLGTPFGLACSAIQGMANVYVNLLAWDAARRAAGSDSLLMQAQANSRRVKLCASLVVATGLTVAALSTDDVIVAFADGAGSFFVACYLARNALEVLRSAVPDLLDRSAGAEVRSVVAGALEAQVGSYSQVLRSRSRRSGQAVFVDLALGFEAQLSMAEVDARVEALGKAIRKSLPDAEVSIVASSVSAAGDKGG